MLVQRYLDGKPGLEKWCADALASFTFVNWDRFIMTKKPDSPHIITCYGWMDRAGDSYKDFVVLNIVLDTRLIMHVASSSVEYTDKISLLCCEISGLAPRHSKQCIRIEDKFDIPNMVKMKAKNKE